MKTTRFITALFCLVLTPLAYADLTMESDISIQGYGSLAVMNSTGKQTIMISGQRARTENKTEVESKLLKSFAANANTATIIRMDDEIMQSLVPEKKQYWEMTFEEMRARLERSMAHSSQMQEAGALPVDDENCEWSEPDLQVTKTRNKEKFAGIKAQQTLITASQTCTDRETGSECKVAWNLDYWIAKKMPAKKEMSAFMEGMAKAMGGDDQLGLLKMQASGLMGMFKRGWDEILDESGDLNGYPVKTVMSLEMGGENCTMPSGQTIAMDDMWSQAADAGIDAAAGTAASHAGHAIGRETSQALGHGVGGSIAGSAIGAASQSMMSGALSKFRGRNKKDEQAEPVAESNPAAESVTLFTITSVLTDFDQRDMADSNFEVPAGWEQVPAH